MAKKPKPKPGSIGAKINAGIPGAGGVPGVTNNKSTTTTDYIGDVPHARRPRTGPFGVSEFPFTQPGYKKGDEYGLLPTNGADLAALQQALIQAGYLNAKSTFLGSPDAATVKAFSQLLASANLSGSDWKSTLASRLAIGGNAAGDQSLQKIPPLTISLTNPDDIKATVQKTAQTLLGQGLSDTDLQNFVNAYQGMERNYQTAQYNQQYNIAGNDQSGNAVGTYGPGGEATAAPTQEGLANQASTWLKATQPQQYQATQFGSMVSDALKNLASTGNL